MGLSLGGGGVAFAGNHGTKGCFTYASGTHAQYAYYGTGGTDAEMSTTSLGNDIVFAIFEKLFEVPLTTATKLEYRAGIASVRRVTLFCVFF